MSQTLPKRVEYTEVRHAESRDFTRFKLYAPFVRSLEIYGKDDMEYEFAQWKKLGQYAKAEPLLPNLVQLTLAAPFLIKSQQQLLWIRTFLAPTILEIRVFRSVDESPLMHMPTVLSLLKHVSTIVPQIQQLSVFIEHEDYLRPDDDADVLGFWEPSWYSYFKNLSALRELTCTEAVLVPKAFSTIARLTSLSVLNIWVEGGAYTVWASLNQNCIPPNPFPALRHFSMRGAHAGDVCIVLDCLAFPHLSSLRIGIDVQADNDPLANGPWEYQLVELITRACPRLADLRIDFDESDRYDEPCNLLLPAKNGSNAIMVMSKLPLETLYISSAILGDTCESFPIDSKYCADYLMTAWPQLTRVHLPRFLGNFNCLYEFSQLPNLEELTLRLLFDYPSFEENGFNYGTDLDELEFGTAPLNTLGTSYLMNPSEVESDHTARALLHFWPNLERISLRLDPDDPVEDYSDILDDLDEINQEIQKLRESSTSSSSGSNFESESGSSSSSGSDGSESSVQL
ncbi:hypothetical protein FRC07_002606 [Ceratobasidium sp. 392]|nr:hypothetical protein FRC07_002606 [Ceratobasidium sp. 392]